MKDLIQETIKRIKKEHIAPEPKWKFLLRKISAWLVVGLVVMLGALAISVGYYLFSQLDFDLHQNAFLYALSVAPYFWFILFGVFIIGAFFGVRKTESGYRFGNFKIIFLVGISVFAIGFFMLSVGFSGRFNGLMMHNAYYAQNIETKEKQWMQPEKGFLAGTIRNVSEDALKLDDLSGQGWEIKITGETLVRPKADISVNQMIKIIGIKQSNTSFIATEVRPWAGGRGMMNGNRQDGLTCGLKAIVGCEKHGNPMK